MAPFCHTIKQLEDKNVANEISHMVWSNRMDLVALSNVKGEVALHRLTWTRAWNLCPPKEDFSVNGLAWRPDGKVLAIAYSSGDVCLVNIETKAYIYKFNIAGELSFISWIQELTEPKQKDIFKMNEDENSLLKFVDLSKPYIRDPPPVAHLEGSINFEEIKNLTSFLQDQSEFNLLLMGTKDGLLHIKIFGCWTCVILDIKKYVGCMCLIENVHVTDDLSKFFVTVKDSDDNVKVIILNSDIFKTHTKELYNVSMKYIKLHEMIAYLGKILTSITETWESILLEIDNKLSKYASKVPEGGVTADFLELLMFGICSGEMEEFLIHDLSKKGLEKFGQTVEMSYSNIQTYLFRHIIKFSQNTTYHLTDLRGMARFEHRYGVIGLNEKIIEEAIRANGGFMIKAGEMQQIINHSVINYKAFFRWLYASIMHIMDESISSEIQKMTQQDLAYITEFLQNFDNYGKSDLKENKFITERLGQYLIDAPLTIKPDMSGNEWSEFLEENECLKNHPDILTHFVDKSLIQVYNELKDSISKLFDAPSASFENQITPIHTFYCFNFDTKYLRMSCVNISNDNILLSFVNPDAYLYLLQVHINTQNKLEARCGKFFFRQFLSQDNDASGDSYKILDVKFYSSSILSILLQECTKLRPGIILQFSVNTALEKMTEINTDIGIYKQEMANINGSNLCPKLFKNIELPPSVFAVSGSRRVSIVLSENRRKVKLFEMEAEEEEDEDAEMTNSVVRESDISMQD